VEYEFPTKLDPLLPERLKALAEEYQMPFLKRLVNVFRAAFETKEGKICYANMSYAITTQQGSSKPKIHYVIPSVGGKAPRYTSSSNRVPPTPKKPLTGPKSTSPSDPSGVIRVTSGGVRTKNLNLNLKGSPSTSSPPTQPTTRVSTPAGRKESSKRKKSSSKDPKEKKVPKARKPREPKATFAPDPRNDAYPENK
jgi:hypothetical protein